MRFYRYCLILAAALPFLASCGKDPGVTAADILSGSISQESVAEEASVSAGNVSMDYTPVVVLDEPVEVIKDTEIKELPFDVLKVSDHGSESVITDGYYRNVLYQNMRRVADNIELQVKLALSLDLLYQAAKEGVLVDFDYGDGTNAYIMIHDKFAYVADRNGAMYLLPAADAKETERLLIESDTVYDAPDTPEGVDGAVKLFKDTGYTGLHPYMSVEMKPGKISTVMLKNDTGEAEFVENEPADSVLRAELCEPGTSERFVDLSRLSDDDLEITVRGAEPYFRITYDTGYSIYISTGYDLTVNCDRNGNITLRDVYAGDNLIIRYDIDKSSYKYCSFSTFTFNGVLMETMDTSVYLKDGIFQVFGSDIANAALTATPGESHIQPMTDYKGSTGGNYLYDFKASDRK